jgi:putative hemolysin
MAEDAPAPEGTQHCLAARGGVDDLSIRGVHVGGKTNIRGADGRPMAVNSVSYCVEGGGEFSFSLSKDQEVVLIMSSADGDSIGAINPTSPAQSARAEFPNMRRITKTADTSVYRVDGRRQLLLGVTGGRVSFVAAADRLLLEYPHKLGYHLRRLGV